MKRVRIRGDEEQRADQRNLLLVQCEVLGVHEQQDYDDVFVADLQAIPPLPATSTVESVVAESWSGLEQDRVIEVAADLIVRPPWVPAPVHFAGIELVVPRGMAFGSGEHASTQNSLRLLHSHWPGLVASALDVGTGSGILAAYAARRGVGRVWACDIEEPAVRDTKRLLPNAGVVRGGPEAFAPGCADLVIANLDGQQLRAHSAAILATWNRRQPLLLSGLRVGDDWWRQLQLQLMAQQESGGFWAGMLRA